VAGFEKGLADRGRLDELGAGADDGNDLQREWHDSVSVTASFQPIVAPFFTSVGRRASILLISARGL
jgi:hypothetical protein